LVLASTEGYLKIVRELLKRPRKIKINLGNLQGMTALMYATGRGHLDIVKELLTNKKINVNLPDIDGNTALILASMEGNLKILQELLTNKKINVNLPDRDGNTALIHATDENHLKIVKELLNYEKIDINFANLLGITALMMASRSSRLEILKELLDHKKIDVNLQEDSRDISALQFALFNFIGRFSTRDENTIRLLLDHPEIEYKYLKDRSTNYHIITNLIEKQDEKRKKFKEMVVEVKEIFHMVCVYQAQKKLVHFFKILFLKLIFIMNLKNLKFPKLLKDKQILNGKSKLNQVFVQILDYV